MQVRQAFLLMLATWLGGARPGNAGTPSGYLELPNGQALTAHRAALFPYVMALLADDSPSVAGNAAACLERLGAQHLEACAQVRALMRNTETIAAIGAENATGL